MRVLLLFISLFFYLHFQAQNNDTKKDTTRSLDPALDLYNLAKKQSDSSNFKAAIKTLKSAIKKKAKYVEAYNLMAACKVQLNDLKGASEDLEMSLRYRPDNFECTKLLGRILFKDKRYDEAKKYYDDAYKIDPLDIELMYYTGELRGVGKDTKGAIETFNTVLDMRETYAPAYLQRGMMRFQQKEYNYAIKDITDGIKYAKPGEVTMEAYQTRARAYFEMGNFKDAITDYSKVIEIDPKNEDAYVYRGGAKINLNDNSGAVADLDKAIDLNGRNHVSYNFRGTAKGGLKQYTAAIKDLDKSIDIKFDYASAYVNRAAIKMTLKDKKGACKDLEKADQLGSNMAYKLIQKYCSGNNY